jgi:hypothetical protein
MSVWKRQGEGRKTQTWCFGFMFRGKRYTRYGFATKSEAQEAELEKRKQVKLAQTHITFLEAANKRLDFLKAYRTSEHFRANRTMLKRFTADWADLFVAEITPEMIRGKLGG